MRHSATKTIFSQWRALRGSRRAPDRSQINPASFGASLPHIFLLEQRGDHSHIRLAGSRLCALFGEELRDTPFADLFSHASTDDGLDMLGAVLNDETPVIAGISALFPDRMSLPGEIILMPMRHDAAGDGRLRILGAIAIGGHRPNALPPCVGLEVLSFRMLTDDAVSTLMTGAAAATLPVPAAQASARRSRFKVYDGGLINTTVT